MKKKPFIIVLLIVATLVFAACGSLDVIGTQSVKSLQAVIEKAPKLIESDEARGGWTLTAPDQSATFFWTRDFTTSTPHDASLTFDIQPFINAGLDPDRLPSGMIVGNTIVLGTQISDKSVTYEGEATPVASYEKIVELDRERIGYHESLDHYGIDLGSGNMFEWAKDLNSNDKDIVFVVDPKVFVEAGVDPTKVDGWVFAKVETMDKDGKMLEVEKFLKPFDLN
jgi:hypothetical protein